MAKKKKEYNRNDVETVMNLKENYGLSIRDIAKTLDIPKSVIGRWVKNPDDWKQTYRFKEVEEKIKDPERKEKYRRAVKKFRHDDRFIELEAEYFPDDDDYAFGY